MLPIRHEKLYTPPSSPASLSSSTWQNSSSPPSSPTFNLDSEDEQEHGPPRSRVIDPLAGSYKANRAKRTSAVFTPPCSPLKKPRFAYRLPEAEPDAEDNQSTSMASADDFEQAIWEDAVNKVFESGQRNIDLSSCNLTHIPPQKILDLGSMVVLPDSTEILDDSHITLRSMKPPDNVTKRRAFTRVQTAPASATVGWALTDQLQKCVSSNHVLNGTSREHVDLYLGNNNISRLPTELWSLHNLRILSLRNNRIVYLPPEIVKLENLVDLNVALNKLKFLPAELMHMKSLAKLIVFPNPFITDPKLTGQPRVSETRPIGSLVPPLTELALRILLDHPPRSFFSLNTKMPETLLEMYDLPLPTGPLWRPISAPLRRILSNCVRGSITADDAKSRVEDAEEGSMEPNGIGVCSNPEHRISRRVFVHHAEERFTWVEKVAGITLGGVAPLRWRGCQQGCLNFLDPTQEEISQAAVVEDEEMEVDLKDAVQTVRFEGGLDFDD